MTEKNKRKKRNHKRSNKRKFKQYNKNGIPMLTPRPPRYLRRDRDTGAE